METSRFAGSGASSRVRATLVVVLVAASLAIAGPAGAQENPDEVAAASAVAIPAPDSATASPETSVSITGVPGSAVGPVGVVGSVSGVHPGTTTDLGDGRGLSFAPSTPFSPGERVEVSSAVPVVGGDTTWSFTVGTPAPHPGLQLDEADPPAPGAETQAAGRAPFASRPDLEPPGVTINTPAADTAAGYLFATPRADFATGSDQGVMIYDEAGEPVWFRPVTSDTPGDLKVITYDGSPALAWFEGASGPGRGNYRGEWVVVDEHYDEVARIRMVNGYQADLHDLLLTDTGTAYLMAYSPLTCTGDPPLTGCSPGSTVLEAVLQEIDLTTGALLWEWHSLDHVPLDASYGSLDGPVVDYFHPNSIDLDTDGNVLLSGRWVSALYKIDRSTGSLAWTFGGKNTSFPNVVDDPLGGPDFPHDFRSRGNGSYSYFDNGSQRQGPSRGALVDLDPETGTATYTTNLVRDPEIFANIQGNLQGLPSGHNLVSWGNKQTVTEFDASGSVVYDAALDAPSYRQRRFGWSGSPTAPPDAVGRAVPSGTEVAMSWNGDTRTQQWQILAGTGAQDLAPVGAPVARTGFETTTVVGDDAWIAVQALDGSGAVLGTSEPSEVGGRERRFAETDSTPVGGAYTPLVGDFGGSTDDDVFYYAPGTAADYLHLSTGSGSFTSVRMPKVDGTYQPLVGDFAGDDRDEILWRSAGRSTAYLWRLDGAARSRSVRVLSRPVTVPQLVTKAVVLDHVRYGPEGFDEVLWYAEGGAGDRIDRYDWVLGRSLRTRSRELSVSGSYLPVSGDVDGNGLADVLWYGPGTTKDYLWLAQPAGAAPTTAISRPVAVGGIYAPTVADYVAGDGRAEVLFDAPGSARDYLWTFRSDGSYVSRDVTTDAEGPGYVLQGPSDELLTWVAGSSPRVWSLDAASSTSVSTFNTPFSAEYEPLVGDFVGADGRSEVLWYAPGSAPEVQFTSP